MEQKIISISALVAAVILLYIRYGKPVKKIWAMELLGGLLFLSGAAVLIALTAIILQQ